MPKLSKRRTDNISKLESFPEYFNGNYFHIRVIEREEKLLDELRYIVYKKVKNSLFERVSEYKTIPINDTFNINIDVDDKYSLFHCSVIREELLDNGFDVESFTLNEEKTDLIQVPISSENSKLTRRIVVIADRKIDIEERLEDRQNDSDCSDSDDSDEE